MKSFFIELIRKMFCIKRDILKEILNIKFNTIDDDIFKLNCFNSDDLSCFINENNIYFKDFFIVENYSFVLNFLKIDSISSSKSMGAGYRFDNIYLFGKNIVIDRGDKWSFEDCIKHVEKDQKILQLIYFKWNNRYSWVNFNGSHHFAAANFIATNNGDEYNFECKIKSLSINIELANKLLNNYEMFIFNVQSYIIERIFNEDIVDVINIGKGYILILLDKGKASNSGYLEFLKLIDEKYVIYFNDYLQIRIKSLKANSELKEVAKNFCKDNLIKI